MKHLDHMNTTRRRFHAGLASLVLLGGAMLGSAQPVHAAGCGAHKTPFWFHRVCSSPADMVAIEDLLVAVHDVTSYNGDEQTAIDHLATWEELWAEDATLVVNGATTFTGRDAIITFFAASSLFNSNLVGLTPSFRTQVDIHGNTAEVYLECIFLNESKAVVAERALHGTVRKVGGNWLFWKMANDPAQPMFP